jgi:hypothetical protein
LEPSTASILVYKLAGWLDYNFSVSNMAYQALSQKKELIGWKIISFSKNGP